VPSRPPGQLCPLRHDGLSWSGCADLKVYRCLLVCSLERQLDGTGKRVQAVQELQCKLNSLPAAARKRVSWADLRSTSSWTVSGALRGPRTAISSRSLLADRKFRPGPASMIGRALRDVLGIRAEEFHPLQPAESVALAGDACADSTWAGRLWAERLRLEGAAVIATYASGDLAGLPAVTRHSFLAGTAWYLSTLLSDNALTTLLGSIIGQAGGVSLGFPGVSVTRRRATDGQSWLFAFNYGDGPASVPVSGVDLVSGAAVADVLCLAPGGYAVVREEPSPDD